MNIRDERTPAADTGFANTAALVAIAGNNYPAAEYCDALDEGGHNDWYLPALNQLISGLTVYGSHFGENSTWGGFAGFAFYWSSTEYADFPAHVAWGAYYDSDLREAFPMSDSKQDDTSYQTRCLR